jgi:dethiobiotin synthetase
MAAIFVTGTGTDIGKTFVTAGLVRHLRRTGRNAAALKPVVSGFDPAAADASDPGVLLAAMDIPVTPDTIARIAPFRFAAPYAPDLAARLEQRTLDFAAVTDFCRTAQAAPSLTFIEGVGGVMVPLDARHTVLDWMAALRCPVVLVAGSYLGALSHTLTCVDVIRTRGLAIAALVVNETPGATVSLADTVASLVAFTGPIPVVAMARNDPAPAFAELAGLLAT